MGNRSKKKRKEIEQEEEVATEGTG